MAASSPFWVSPFALLLGCIAVMPLAARHFWEQNLHKAIVSVALAAPVFVLLVLRDVHALEHALLEYLSFVVLLGALYVVAGGVHLSGDLLATPMHNTAILGAGAVLANVMGTTGASMLLIHLVLRTNKQRRFTSHIPFFFILIVSNCGGLLTPLGDPPLFLGYLRGVPFTWTLGLWPAWLVCIAYLLALFYFTDHRAYEKESKEAIGRDLAEAVPLSVRGWPSAFLLAVVVGAVFLLSPYRELAMVVAAFSSLYLVPQGPRKDNEFQFGPIIEVGILFFGIFVTMVPALKLLEAEGPELGITTPAQFFWITGALSSVLDNAPTYLTFLSVAEGLGLPREVLAVTEAHLIAISIGAVFMGANTYIGNGPNFMVKAVADANGYETPSFGAYAARAVVTLSPVYLVVTLWLWFSF